MLSCIEVKILNSICGVLSCIEVFRSELASLFLLVSFPLESSRGGGNLLTEIRPW